MCVGKNCGTFRVYVTSEPTAEEYWRGLETTPPDDEDDIKPLTDINNENIRNEAIAKYKQGIENRWGAPAHSGEECPNGCRCVMTTEQIGEDSVEEVRPWRQPMTLSNGARMVVRGTYKKKFGDYKGECDSNDEVGEPISWEESDVEYEEPAKV